ncbi:transporter [Porphyromonas crevioricanis]|uniref:Lysosomal dipeptide transporter MFSD1 n=2 Tax=Porphyromonas crevioricanis TaxID=393921 RepID=A0AB34PJA2_9PORP|nr:MFS transporter [Porphyromonas crevioricanis]KGN88909.1 transporter [Porphyromonas crevioricanis]KGN95817.1 transporter [Porphyromonas crevioricanis]
MDQTVQTMRDKPLLRWTVLILLASTMLFAYMFVDILSPLQAMLTTNKGWSPVDYGNFAGSEMFLNVFFFFLIFAGIILDKMGARRTAILSGVVMVIGAFLKYYAVSSAFEGSAAEAFFTNNFNLPKAWWNVTPFFEGMAPSAKMASVAFMIFGCGVEMAGITVSRAIVKWFQGYELAMAMGVEMAIARLGVAAAVLLGPRIADMSGLVDVSRPVLLCAALMCIGLLSFFAFFFMDKKLDAEIGHSTEEKDDPFKFKDLGRLFGSKTFLIVALLCMLYYSAIFPFQKYAINMLQCNLNMSSEDAGWIFFFFPLGAAAITPFLGNFLDHKGKGATMLMLGAILMISCHSLFAFLPHFAGAKTVIAFLAIILLGISFSLVPAALWPSVPKLVEGKLLGSAYAVIFWIQNIGLYSFPMIIGNVLRSSNPNVEDPLQYNYMNPMLVFASLGIAALILGFWLKAEDRRKGYGLELPNIKKK